MSASVLPTHVGMSLTGATLAANYFSAPHTRGDEPTERGRVAAAQRCSPHTWG